MTGSGARRAPCRERHDRQWCRVSGSDAAVQVAGRPGALPPHPAHHTRTHPGPARHLDRASETAAPGGEQEVRPLMNAQTTTRQFISTGSRSSTGKIPICRSATADDLQSYATRGDWVMLFNALTLLSVPVQPRVGTISGGGASSRLARATPSQRARLHGARLRRAVTETSPNTGRCSNTHEAVQQAPEVAADVEAVAEARQHAAQRSLHVGDARDRWSSPDRSPSPRSARVA